MGKYWGRMRRGGRWTLMKLMLLAPIALRWQTQPSPTNGTIDAVMPAYNTFRHEEDWSFLKVIHVTLLAVLVFSPAPVAFCWPFPIEPSRAVGK